ncbi:Voltage-gated Ion Channel [Phytophthora cinnamomi]|uniref:Voltage-gated Ion Channel n=1 Tax=Phytophthora cinnamomi TaxID=4785 RepID=UPI00355AADAC|nr:Voltage-gated Ion Channel [Phytophthora cinnamomi]
MDGTLPSYEAAMRDAREYLRRRDLNSQDEIPLYFAWERLYAAANANLSTDFLNETRAELRARQQARLAPRQGLPPPLFTSFDKLNRKSIQSSAFLRSGLSSDAAIEMMARRYRREAEKLRSSRDKLVTSSLSDTGKRVKKSKRNKRTPQEEVDELLEDLERPISTENSRFVASKLMKDRVETSSDGGGKRTKKINEQQRNPGREVEELLAKFEKANILPESKMSASTRAKSKDGLDFAGGKDAFADELAAGANAAKTTELRRSSFSMGNPATDPVLADVENLAAFAAQVSDWRMHPSADAATLPPKPVQSGVTSTTKGSKRVGGANRTRKSAVVEGEADTTFDTSSGSSGPDEDNSNTYGSIRSSAVSTSPTSRRSTAHTSEWEDGDEDNMSVNNSATAS